MPTDNRLSEEALAKLDAIKDVQMVIIANGMLQLIKAHEVASLVHGVNMPDDCAMVVCGKVVYERLLALHEQHLEVTALDVAASAIGKAKAP